MNFIIELRNRLKHFGFMEYYQYVSLLVDYIHENNINITCNNMSIQKAVLNGYKNNTKISSVIDNM